MPEGYHQEAVQPDYVGLRNVGFSVPPATWPVPTGASPAQVKVRHITTTWVNKVELTWVEDLSASPVERTNHVVSDGLLAGLQQIYPFEQPFSVAEFLKAHPFLVNILLEAYPKMTAVFGEGVMATLRLVDEPDFPCESELFAVTQTDLPPDEALRRLNALDEEWWLEASPRARSRLNFTVEYL